MPTISKKNGLTLYEERPKYDDAKAKKEQEQRERMRARANHEREISAQFSQLRNGFMENLTLKGKEAEAQSFVLWVLSRSEYLSQAMVNGLFDRTYLAKRENKPESYSGCVKVTNDELYELIPDKKLLHAMVLVAYDRITYDGMSMLDRYSGEFKENRTLKDLYWHLTELGYDMSKDEEAWMDGTHECFSYPHEESEDA